MDFSVTVQIEMRDQGLQKKSKKPSFSSNSLLSCTHVSYPSGLSWVQKTLTYFRFPQLLSNKRLVHGVFTRVGGLSSPPYDSLNTAYMVGDTPDNVTVNLDKIKKTIGSEHLMFMNQAHGNAILVFGQDHNGLPYEVPSGDAMITNIPGIALMVKQADCQGVIIFDPERCVLANVHCGWRGNVNNILGGVVTRMKKDFGCRASDLIVAIGPSLGPCCAEFVSHKDIFPRDFMTFMVRENYFDLWAVSCWQLLKAGVLEENIELSGICTRCRTDLFYSYRAEGTTGRFGTVAMIR